MRMFDLSEFRGLFYGHRGLYDNGHGVPENSLPAFRAAAEKAEANGSDDGSFDTDDFFEAALQRSYNNKK